MKKAAKKSVKKAAKKAVTKKAAPKKAAKKGAMKKSAVAKRTAMKKAAPKKAAVKKAATKKVAPKKAVAKKADVKKVALKKTAVKRPAAKKAAPQRPVTKKVAKKAVRKPSPAEQQRLTKDWPQPLQPELTVKQGEGPDASAELEQPTPKPHKSFAQQAKERQAKPNELHPGQTAQSGSSHDRPGSQPERVRHQYPNANQPNAGSGRSTGYKGKRLDNGDRTD